MNLLKTKTIIEERAKELLAINVLIQLRAEKGYEDIVQMSEDSILAKQVFSEIEFLQKLIKSLS